MSRIFLRPIGSPLPLGMAELAGASVLLTGDQLGWLPAAQGPTWRPRSCEEPGLMPPGWLTALSWAALALAFGSAGWIILDVYGCGYRQQMGIMEVVWPVTALCLGPVAAATGPGADP